jgi:hypothetical protein
MVNKKGFIVIAATLVLLMVTIGITSMLLFLSIGGAKISESLRQGEQALFFSESCLEEGLLRLKADPLYGGGQVVFPDGVCHIAVSQENENYNFQVSFSSDAGHHRSVEAQAEIVDGILVVKRWNEAVSVIE